MLRKLVDIQYERSDYDFHRGTFRVRGDIVEIFPAYEDARRCASSSSTTRSSRSARSIAMRGKVLRRIDKATIYPASHYVTSQERMKQAVRGIRDELKERLNELRDQRKLLEAQRLEQRTLYDLELLAEMGFCPGIENYSRHLTGRKPGEPPPTLAQLFSRRFSAVHRREPRHRAADRRHVSRRPLAQRDLGRISVFACRRRSTTGRSISKSSRAW